MAGAGETRERGLELARKALTARKADFVQSKFHGDVFLIRSEGRGGAIVVRPKVTSGRFEGDSWPWDAPPSANEDFYLLVLLRKGPKFWIVPSDFVRGALEGGHANWYEARKERPKIGSEPMRVLMPWAVRAYEERWDLLGLPRK